MRQLLLCLFASAVTSCTDEREIPNPIVGTWVLSEKFVNDKRTPLKDCESKNYLVVLKGTEATFYNHHKNPSAICEASPYYVKLYRNDDGSYKVKPISIIDQNQKIILNNRELIYSWDAWDITDTSVITTPIKEIYVKK